MKEDGIVLIDKPSGMTSFGVVARVRRVLGGALGKKVRTGHTGTLDPFATGLMIVVTGKECKNAMTYTKLDKVYEATITLGETSSTGDPEGEITQHDATERSREDIVSALQKFVGEIEQTPPIYSAIKINGERAYKLARQGKTVDMPPRHVTVYSLEMLNYAWPKLTIRAHVSSGTYIRTLAEDIGRMLGTGAYCTDLRRTKIADFDVQNAVTVDDFLARYDIGHQHRD